MNDINGTNKLNNALIENIEQKDVQTHKRENKKYTKEISHT